MKNVLVTSQSGRKGRVGIKVLQLKLNQISYRSLTIVTIYLWLPGSNHEENNRLSCLPGLTRTYMFHCGFQIQT